MVDFIKTQAWQILTLLFLVLFLGKGCNGSKISKTNKHLTENNTTLVNKLDSLTLEIISLKHVTLKSDEAMNIMERVMLDFLIYEDDLDRGKISLSQIKDRVESND